MCSAKLGELSCIDLYRLLFASVIFSDHHPLLSISSHLHLSLRVFSSSIMKFTTALPVVFLGFAMAAPVAEPQDIDFNAYNAVPIADDLTAPVGNVVAEAIVYDPTAAAATAIAAATGGANPDLSKRNEKRVACAPNTAGNYPTISPDTPEGFLASPDIAAIANAAVAPPGYFLSAGYKNLQASASNPSYKTYVSSPLTSYDTVKCGQLCTDMPGCNSFNICMYSLANSSTNTN